MQNLRWLIAAFALSLLSVSTSAASEVVRIVTWNLLWFPGGKPFGATPEEIDASIAAVRDGLEAIRPDVVILQEVSSEAAVEELIAPWGPNWKVHVVSGFRAGGMLVGQQIAIASWFPASVSWFEEWGVGWAGPPRGYAFVRIEIGGRSVDVYGLHLKSNLGNAVENTAKREDAAEQLLAHIAHLGSDLCVLAGDFNTSPDAEGERTFPMLQQEGFFWTFDGVPFESRITCPAKGRYPPASFDHILVKGLGRPVAQPLPSLASESDFVLDPRRVSPCKDFSGRSGKNLENWAPMKPDERISALVAMKRILFHPLVVPTSYDHPAFLFTSHQSSDA